MSIERNINIFNAYLKLMITLISGAIRLAIHFITVVPRVVSKLLNVLIKLGAVYKLLIDPALRSIGAFFAGMWRGLMQWRAAQKKNKNEA